VPQHVYLADTTIAGNIAFGIGKEQIDVERVAAAARQARLDEFIRSRAGGYDAYVGERGVRLSGGQRQRLGIARALYCSARVLVLDEATSALDAVTESEVIDAIEAADRSTTVVIVAHRVATIRYCDMIVELSDGRVTAIGTYDDLVQASPSFRYAAGISGGIE
jgi:ATP-binding cassette subfamily B protein